MGCLNCPQTEERLDLDDVMYNAFGGWSLHKNGEYFYSASPSEEIEWEKYPKVKDFEKMAREDETAKWEIELSNPLRGAIYERIGENNWVLKSKNNGFA